jgi:hypothetical protein
MIAIRASGVCLYAYVSLSDAQKLRLFSLLDVVCALKI